MTSYPIALPSPFRVQILNLGFQANVAVGESPYSYVQEVQIHQGQRWAIHVACPPLERADADQVVAFLMLLNGREGTFLCGDPSAASPRGLWAGTPIVDNGSPNLTLIRQNQLPLRGLTASTTIKAGDMFQLGSGSAARLYRNLIDATAGGTGRVTLTVWPNLQSEPNDGDSVVTSAPKGVFRMSENDQAWSVSVARHYGINFSAMSVV